MPTVVARDLKEGKGPARRLTEGPWKRRAVTPGDIEGMAVPWLRILGQVSGGGKKPFDKWLFYKNRLQATRVVGRDGRAVGRQLRNWRGPGEDQQEQ